MTHVKQRLPLSVSAMTPSRIQTADGFAVSVEWRNTGHANPYGDAEEFAAYIVTAVNSHEALIARMGALEEALRPFISILEISEDNARKQGRDPADVSDDFDVLAFRDVPGLKLSAFRKARAALAISETQVEK